MPLFRFFATLLMLALVGAPPALAQQRAPLEAFTGYDTLRGATLSPNGRYVALIRRESVGDVLVVYDRQTRALRPIQTAAADAQMQIDFVEFKSDTRVIFGFSQRVRVVADSGRSVRRTRNLDDGFERVSRVYASSLDGGQRVSLYEPDAQQGLPRWVSASLVSPLASDPDHILLLAPKAGGAELWKVNVQTGERTIVDRGGMNTFNWIADVNGTPVLRQDVIAGGRGFAWSRRGPGQRDWTEIVRFRGASGANSGPTFEGVGPALAPGQVFVLARRDGQDTSGLYVFDTATGAYVETLQTNPNFDVSAAVRDVQNNTVLAACWWGYRWTCEPKDEAFAPYWRGLTQALGEDVNVRLITRGGEGGRLWLVQTNGPLDLGTYYLYDTASRQLNILFNVRPSVERSLLPTKRIIEYAASDGESLWGYLWVPPGVTNAANLPLIVVPHGGPEGRDVWGDDPFAISFASQGYAVFQPNFRGGGGFGRRFVEAGHRQWGQRMQADVADGARYLISSGIADPNRICIAGWSYGGYAAFTATFENADLYRCAMAGAGVSDLPGMLRWVRVGDPDEVISGGGVGSQGISYRYWTQAIGDPSADRAMLERYSAVHNVERIAMPLLIIHGDEDQTVPFEQSEIMERAMRRAGRPVRLVRLADTDHYFTPDQGEAWSTVMSESLAFFNQHIGPGVPPGAQ